MANTNIDIKKIGASFEDDLSAVDSLVKLTALKTQYLGKRGILASLFAELKTKSVVSKKELGFEINTLKKRIELMLAEMEQELQNTAPSRSKLLESIPGIQPEIGHLHITSKAIREIVEVFKPLGFARARYPEIEWEYYAFEALNVPSSHPARDEWETFFLDSPKSNKYGKMVITPHTSSGQVREMLKTNPPIKMLNIARCGRRQEDLRHLPTFFQFEGMLVDKDISIKHLVGVVEYFVHNFFSKDRQVRFRPYDFRFTEPSFEIDISCGICAGAGCKFCKEGWVELGGAGMIHPNVLKAGGIDPEKYTGFAFGWGVERTYMMKSNTNIDDIRILFKNDLRFLEQF